MLKKTAALLGAVLILMGLAGCSGSETNSDSNTGSAKNFTYTLDEDGNATITSYTGSGDKLKIPEALKGHTVIGIEDKAFMDMSNITEISVPDTLKDVGFDCFKGTAWLENYTDDMVIIGNVFYAYQGSEESVVIPEEIECVASSAFINNTSIKEVTFPENAEIINNATFSGCTALEKVNLGSAIKEIRSGAFSGCTALAEIQIPESVDLIDTAAFTQCSALTSVVLPEGLETLGMRAFADCSNLEKVNIPSTVTFLGGYAFMNCISLQSITVPASVQTVPQSAFWSCSELKDVVIEDGIDTIGGSAFAYCSKLERIIIPASVTDIISAENNSQNELPVFEGCDNLTIISSDDSYAKTYAEENSINFKTK